MIVKDVSQGVALILEQQAKVLKEYIEMCNHYRDTIEELEGIINAQNEDMINLHKELEKCKEHNEELVESLNKCRCNSHHHG